MPIRSTLSETAIDIGKGVDSSNQQSGEYKIKVNGNIYDDNHFLIRETDGFAGMDDSGMSSTRANSTIAISENNLVGFDDIIESQMHNAGLFKRSEIDLFNKRYRFGILNPSENITSAREYLFFTKPDLNIYPRSNLNNSGTPDRSNLNGYLRSQAYWRELAIRFPQIIECLQESITLNPFNHLLANAVESHLEIPSLQSDMIDTPTNTYGVGYSYHGSSEASDDGFDFSLEFKDTKYLPVYHFFRAYEEYQTFKHHGLIEPWHQYIIQKVLYDHYSIYKFLVDEDGETIIYYAKLYGVKSKSLPRDTFADNVFDNGISYTIDFNAAFFEDMKPHILDEFNRIAKPYCDTLDYHIDIYNHIYGQTDNRPAQGAYIAKVKSEVAPGGYVYKLLWKGSDKK